ncbi:hypothetical protein K461DRAFT_322739 [Myriangium duriaei CBS 260.36]|uniref:Apple domain-containing protein n=1 Tax=Myriangium duriaei CBS 260.36 TaxID=1168546 RepID=A0A9P4J331_9PEZI|nr:hypothetical protein K461DRAFT_322739 [Myriangium duriaei CBS 260.36]
MCVFTAILHLVFLLIFPIAAASATETAPGYLSRRSSLCVSKDINLFKSVVVKYPNQFCTWWQTKVRGNTPFAELTSFQVDNVCKCILKQQTKRSGLDRLGDSNNALGKRATTSCTTAGNDKLKADFTEYKSFCTFFNSASRTSSPFPDWSAADLTQQCTCVLTSTTTSTITTTTKKTTTTTTTTMTTTTTTKKTTSTTTATTPLKPTTTMTTTIAKVTSTASATGSFCASQNTATLLPIANPTVDRNALANLKPSSTAVLDYAQASPGTSAASIQYDMLYPQVTLEDSAFISSVTCASGKLTVELAQDKGSVAVISAWPQTGLVLLTKSSTCNTATTRGVYIVNGWTNNTAVLSALSFTYNVQAATWQDVAKTMKISYGTVRNGSLTQTASSQCSTSYAHSSTSIMTTTSSKTTTTTTTTTSSAPFVTPTSFDDLSPGAKQIVLYVLYKTKYNADGSIKLFQVNATNNATTIPMAQYNPDNSTLQAALLATLDKAGLPSPTSLVKAAQDALTGLCAGPTQANSTSSTATSSATPKTQRRSSVALEKRDDFEDYACNDYTEAVFGDYDDAVCGAYDLYSNRQAIACLFTGCYETTEVKLPPVYTYDFTQTWKASFGLQPNSAVVSWSDGSKLTCIKCGLNLDQFQLKGTIVAVLDTKELRDATLTVTENSSTDMVFQLDAVHPVAYNWTSSLSTGDLQSISVDGVFTLTPNVIFSMGVEFSADSAISVQGGASLSVSNAQTSITLSTLNTHDTANWSPSVQVTNPAFSKSAKVELVPYVRRLISINFNILNKAANKIAFGSVSALGYSSEFLDADGEVCPANTLQLKSYLYNTNSIIYGDNVYSTTLSSLTRNNRDVCFNVPSDRPTVDEIAALRSTAQDFCTVYNSYIQPTSGVYLVSTKTTLSTSTVTTTSTVQAIPTVTATTSTTTGKVRTIYSTAYITSNVGDESLDSTYLQKRAGIHPRTTAAVVTASAQDSEAIATARIQARDIVAPTMVADWPKSKISYACSQVATGTTTRTFYTSTATAYNATLTSSSTIYTAFQGPAVTSYSILTSYDWSTTTVAGPQKTVPASCPLQTQVSCFTVTGHGPASIDGKYLHVKQGVLNPSFDNTPTVFFLSCEGKLTALPDLRVLGGPTGPSKIAFNTWGPKYAAMCTRDSVTKELNCLRDGGNIMYGWTPPVTSQYWDETYLKYVSPWDDSGLWMPTWGYQADASEYSLVTLTTQDVTCPCTLDTTIEAIASVDSTTPSCPASDGVRYTSADGDVWQIQCGTSYSDTARSTTSASTLFSCLKLCDADLKCTGAVWDSGSNSCVLKSSMLSDSYPSGGTIHSVIRLKNPPVCPTPGSNLINNGGFESGLSPWTASVPNGESPSSYGIRNPGANSGNSYKVTFSGNIVELDLDYKGNDGNGMWLVGGVDYTISGNYKSDSNKASSTYCYVMSMGSTNSVGRLDLVPGWLTNGQVNQWVSTSSTFTPKANGYYWIRCFWVGQPGQSTWIDDITLTCAA